MSRLSPSSPSTGRLADVPAREIGRRLARYSPLLGTVAITLGVLTVLPDESTSGSGHAAAESSAIASDPVGRTTSGPTSEADPAEDSGTIAVPAPDGLSPLTTAWPTMSRPAASDSSTSDSPTTPASSAPPTTRARPPAIVATGWATRDAGLPTATLGVPEGTLPVGKRAGQLDKASFLRLDGDWTLLVLEVDASGSRGVADAGLQACAITTSDWDPGPGASFDDAPEWDDEQCVTGRQDAGRWFFDLDRIDSRHGVALVPAPDAPLDFQVTFTDP